MTSTRNTENHYFYNEVVKEHVFNRSSTIDHLSLKRNIPNMVKKICTVQLTTKFTLMCTIHECVYQFYSRDQLEFVCHCTQVILRALHSSHTLSATCEWDMTCYTRVRLCVLHVSQTLCAACESDFVCCTRVIVRSYTTYISLQTVHQIRE